MRKLDPRGEKIAVNEAFADRYGKAKKKGTRRKERRARTLIRAEAHLRSLGVDPSESEAPLA